MNERPIKDLNDYFEYLLNPTYTKQHLTWKSIRKVGSALGNYIEKLSTKKFPDVV